MAIKTGIYCDICGYGFNFSGCVLKERLIMKWRRHGGSYIRQKKGTEIHELYRCKKCRDLDKEGNIKYRSVNDVENRKRTRQ